MARYPRWRTVQSPDCASLRDLHSPQCQQRPYWSPWYMWMPETVLMSVVCAATRDHVGVHDRGYHWLLCMAKKSFVGVGDCWLILENETHRRLLWPPHLPRYPLEQRQNKTVPTGSYWWESWKPVVRMLKCSSLPPMASVGGGVRKDSVFFKGLATGLLTMLQWVHGQHRLDLVYFFLCCLFFLLSCGGVPRVGSEDWEASVIGVHCMKFPNNY